MDVSSIFDRIQNEVIEDYRLSHFTDEIQLMFKKLVENIAQYEKEREVSHEFYVQTILENRPSLDAESATLVVDKLVENIENIYRELIYQQLKAIINQIIYEYNVSLNTYFYSIRSLCNNDKFLYGLTIEKIITSVYKELEVENINEAYKQKLLKYNRSRFDVNVQGNSIIFYRESKYSDLFTIQNYDRTLGILEGRVFYFNDNLEHVLEYIKLIANKNACEFNYKPELIRGDKHYLPHTFDIEGFNIKINKNKFTLKCKPDYFDVNKFNFE